MFILWRPCHIFCIDKVSYQCEFLDVFWDLVCCKITLTLAALIWLLSSMRSYMYCKICLFCDSHVTLAKLIRILTSVSSYMHWNIFCFVWKPCNIGCFELSNVMQFFTRVSSQISFIILFCCECFLTLDLLVLFRLTICTHMGNNIAFRYERVITLAE